MALEWACKNVVSKWFDADGHAVDKDSSVCYPSKMYSAGINGMLALAELCPDRADEYIRLARCCADRLIGISEPEGAPLAGFTPTYFKIDGLSMWCSTEYFGMNMLVYPACCGESFIELYQRVGDEKYLRAARLIAETYERMRLPNGTWHLKVWTKDGTPVKPNYLVPMEVISFMQRLGAVTGEKKWNDLAEGAIDYVRKGPLTDWNWEGQYEDVEPSGKYINLTMHGAGSYQLCLLARKNRDAATEATARELLRFMEDQFTCWEMPITPDNVIPLNKEMDFSPNQYARDTLAAWLLPGIDKHCLNPLIRDIGTRGTWALPCALEQYHCYRPVDGSSAKLIYCYTAMFETYGNPLDLLKAKALADTLTRVQEPDGRIMTFLRPGTEEAYGLWPNCIIYSALALRKMATYQ